MSTIHQLILILLIGTPNVYAVDGPTFRSLEDCQEMAQMHVNVFAAYYNPDAITSKGYCVEVSTDEL